MNDPTKMSQLAEIRNSILSEDGSLKLNHMTSLKKTVMARIVSNLWTSRNTQQQIVHLRMHRKFACTDLSAIEMDIDAKVLQLLLPKSLCQELRILVPLWRELLCNLIDYHDKCILDHPPSDYCAADLIHNVTWTTRGRIDYLQTAKNIFEDLTIDLNYGHKCKLACVYCLGDEIPLLLSKFGDNIFSSSIKIDPMVCFWRAQITNDMTLLNQLRYELAGNPHNAMSINERLIQLLIKGYGKSCDMRNNDVPLRFLWNKLHKEERARNSVLFKSVSDSDFIITFLSNLDNDEQQSIIQESSDTVLHAIISNWWWGGKLFFIDST